MSDTISRKIVLCSNRMDLKSKRLKRKQNRDTTVVWTIYIFKKKGESTYYYFNKTRVLYLMSEYTKIYISGRPICIGSIDIIALIET